MRGIPVMFRTKVEIALELVPKLQELSNVKWVTFDTWYVNEDSFPRTVLELKSNARVVEGDKARRVRELVEGVNHVVEGPP